MPPARFDHVVVLMFENRSFDNVLGFLYQPGEVPAFEGVAGRSLSNPVPAGSPPGLPSTIPVHPATNMDTPDPDPGEEYPHVNTQLFGTVDPSANSAKSFDDMEAPFNAPPSTAGPPPMNGFVADYLSTFQVELDARPSEADLAQIMACYTPQQLPVLSTLAREFAVFDHWFCEVPSQTYPNRSFFHAGSSSGFVLNTDPPGKFATENTAPTIFERLTAAGRTWRVYIDPAQILPATALIHARQLAPFFATNFRTIFDFYEEARDGTLPDYAFLEPNMLHPHTDMHPPLAGRIRRALHLPAPTAMQGGERLLADVYNAIRSSSSPTGSNWQNTLFLVTFDEHGGTFDHVPPPPAPPPGDNPRHEMGFLFDRSGVRIPAIVVSAWVDPRTVVTTEYRSTSLIRTLRERWSLGPALTPRDAIAADIAPVLTRGTPRTVDQWPSISVGPPGLLERIEDFVERPLGQLERDLVGEAIAHEALATGRPSTVDVLRLGHREAHDHLMRVRDSLFPGIVGGRTR